MTAERHPMNAFLINATDRRDRFIILSVLGGLILMHTDQTTKGAVVVWSNETSIVLRRGDDICPNYRFQAFFVCRRIWRKVLWISDRGFSPVPEDHWTMYLSERLKLLTPQRLTFVGNRRSRIENMNSKLLFQPLSENLHVKNS